MEEVIVWVDTGSGKIYVHNDFSYHLNNRTGDHNRTYPCSKRISSACGVYIKLTLDGFRLVGIYEHAPEPLFVRRHLSINKIVRRIKDPVQEKKSNIAIFEDVCSL